MLLYRGSRYVKGNKFVDPSGATLVFEKNTKEGKLFVTEKGNKIGLTESQVQRLQLLEKSVKLEDTLDESTSKETVNEAETDKAHFAEIKKYLELAEEALKSEKAHLNPYIRDYLQNICHKIEQIASDNNIDL